ncbi:uncharacterized protein N0V89_008636 [Didymosphaeria variabile]|uniref:Haloacid dehalogenase n=1 Tax=Didymosphaeria variabile TaxID=1932322 RepID=A0A9W9C7Z8_9PLEO|nr:uncharacterized protein N0V89_008636 [Didymosphaeria variabile]KAJ4350015.1 hypothetical protein N0V89_008636 [Didymosphaeria variabile]
MPMLPPTIQSDEASSLALQWRQQYFNLNATRVEANQGVEPFDTTLGRALDHVLSHKFSHLASHFDTEALSKAIRAFHNQKAWPDVAAALQALRSAGLETFVHANGSTRLQLDIVASSGLNPEFNMLFSSELLGLYMPAPEAYHKALRLIDAQPHEVVKVAAHAWDLRGAKELGIKTVYVRRWTDDVEEDMDALRHEFDGLLESMEGLPGEIERLNVVR